MDMDMMDSANGRSRSHLFTLRVWEEETGFEQSEWRGKVQLITSGEVRYFRDWAALAPLLLAMLSESVAESAPVMEPDKQQL